MLDQGVGVARVVRAYLATPTLVVTTSSRPSTFTGRRSSATILRAIVAASSGPDRLLSTTGNSSPPMRATVSSSRRLARRRAAISTSSLSPTAWPRLSLMRLKRSRSTNITASRQRRRAAWSELDLQAVVEQAAVGQAGERVVIGEVADARLGLLGAG